MKDIKIAVIGLGYVGLPLARLFSTKYPTVGYDLNPKRVEELMNGYDSTLEVDDSLLQSALAGGFRCPIQPRLKCRQRRHQHRRSIHHRRRTADLHS